MEILIEKKALSYALVQEIISKISTYQIIPSYETYKWNGLTYSERVSEGKNKIFLLYYPGRFFRKCPGTKNYFCCGYKIFHFAEGCPFDCSYCILQCYFNRPGIKLWANLIEDGFSELKSALRLFKKLNKILRIGTGEFTDSIALESLCKVSEKLVYLWKEEDPFAVIEFKTKAYIPESYFEKLPSDPRIIFAWSLNTSKIISKEEKKTAPLEKRIESALFAIKKGFTVAFHFDPIIYYENGQEEYALVLEKVLNTIPSESIAWISLGTLRYPKELKYIAQERFPQTKIFAYEFVDGLDKKKRYFKILRKKVYKNLKDLILAYQNKIVFYFCMENAECWKEIMEKEINNSSDVAYMLDQVAKKLIEKAKEFN